MRNVIKKRFFVGTTLTIALGCGYLKSVNVSTRLELDFYEYREDFEHVIKDYQNWISIYANTLSKNIPTGNIWWFPEELPPILI